MQDINIATTQSRYYLCYQNENKDVIPLIKGDRLTELYDITTLYENSRELATQQFHLWDTTRFVIAKEEQTNSRICPLTTPTMKTTSYPILYDQDPRYPYIRSLLLYYEQHPTQDQDFPNWLFHRSLDELIHLEKIRIHNEQCFSQKRKLIKEKNGKKSKLVNEK